MKVPKIRRILITIVASALVVFSATSVHAQCEEIGREFEQLIEENFCQPTPQSKAVCLEPIVFNACRNGCRRYGYNQNLVEVFTEAEWNPRLNIHGSLRGDFRYLLKLRDAAFACPEQPVELRINRGNDDGAKVEMSLSDLLWNQTETLLRSGQARFYDANRQRLSSDEVTTPGGNTIDPSRFHHLTWVTEGGRAHAMTQADAGSWFASLARGKAAQGDSRAVNYYLQLTRAVFRPFSVPDNEGGVRNNKRSYRCHANLYCYWFHSRSVGSDDFPGTALNQHLHGVRDVLSVYRSLVRWRAGNDGYVAPTPMPREFADDSFIEELRELARGALFQLAFAPGRDGGPAMPPNLGDFAVYDPVPLADDREGCIAADASRFPYYAAYDYYFDGAKPNGERNRPHCIKPANTCQYHYHSVDLLAGILSQIRTDPSLWGDRHFRDVYFKLLYGREPGNASVCKLLGGQNEVINSPLAGFYLASLRSSRLRFQDNCDKNQSFDFTDATGEFEFAALFFREAYAGCTLGVADDPRPNAPGSLEIE